MLAGPHPRSFSRGGYAPRSGRRRYNDERTMANAYRIVGVPIRAAQAAGQNSRVVPESANWSEKVVA